MRSGGTNGLTGTYYDGINFSGANTFSGRWTGQVMLEFAETYSQVPLKRR